MKIRQIIASGIMSLSISLPLIAQNQPTTSQRAVQNVVRTLFDGLAESNAEKITQSLTADSKIFETGVIFTTDTLVNFVKRIRPADFKRVNTIEFLQTEVTKEMAFVSYYNRADVHVAGKDFVVNWIESAVLINNGKQWKIKMLHSTKLDPAKH